MWFNIYLTFMQYLQFTYQRGCLYRLRSLGERDDMDITIDGFHSWMWKGKYYSPYCKDFWTLFKTFSRKNLGRYVNIRVSQRINSKNLIPFV